MQVPTHREFPRLLWRDAALHLSIVAIERNAGQGLEAVVFPCLFGSVGFG